MLVKNIEQKCFIYHQMYHGDWESHRECLTPVLMDDVTEWNILKFKS